MKKTVIKSLQKLFSGENTFLKTKDTVFCNPAEHLFRTNLFIKKNYSNKTNLHVLDIGAADGGSAHYFSKQLPNAKVLAFEPINAMYKIACETNKGNPNVIIKNIGLFNTAGKARINITQNKLSSSLQNINKTEIKKEAGAQQEKYAVISQEEITISTLDEEAKTLDEILLIKIDTQGTELEILRHGTNTLKKTHLLLIEMNNNDLYENGCQYYEVDELMRNNNFKLVDIIVTYRANGLMKEYDAIYQNTKLL